MDLKEICSGKSKDQLEELGNELALLGKMELVTGIEIWRDLVGEEVEVVKGRKVPIGTIGKVAWVGARNYQGAWWSWQYIVGIETDKGRVFTNHRNIKRRNTK